MPNQAALQLPDQLLVRYFRQGTIDAIASVDQNKETRDIVVSLQGGATEKWKYLTDLGWIPDAD